MIQLRRSVSKPRRCHAVSPEAGLENVPTAMIIVSISMSNRLRAFNRLWRAASRSSGSPGSMPHAGDRFDVALPLVAVYPDGVGEKVGRSFALFTRVMDFFSARGKLRLRAAVDNTWTSSAPETLCGCAPRSIATLPPPTTATACFEWRMGVELSLFVCVHQVAAASDIRLLD